MDVKAIIDRLTTKSLKTLQKKKIVRKVSFESAYINRDNIAKEIYENIFFYLCERINDEFNQIDEEDVKPVFFIGILDIFGFSNFGQIQWNNYINFAS